MIYSRWVQITVAPDSTGSYRYKKLRSMIYKKKFNSPRNIFKSLKLNTKMLKPMNLESNWVRIMKKLFQNFPAEEFFAPYFSEHIRKYFSMWITGPDVLESWKNGMKNLVTQSI